MERGKRSVEETRSESQRRETKVEAPRCSPGLSSRALGCVARGAHLVQGEPPLSSPRVSGLLVGPARALLETCRRLGTTVRL